MNGDGGKAVVAQIIKALSKPPAEDGDIGGGKGEGDFLRRGVFVIGSIGIGVERTFDQLAGVERLAVVFIQMELDAGRVGVGRMVTNIFQES